MIRHRLNFVRLGGLIRLGLFSLLVVIITASCEDELDRDIQEVDRLFVTGPRDVAPDATETYTVKSGSVTWSVTGPATLSATSGESIDVTFTGSGDVQISVSGAGMTGIADVAVANIDLAVEVTYERSGNVHNGYTDVVYFDFPAPLASTPGLRQNGTNAADTSFFDSTNDGLAPFMSTGEVSLSELTPVSGSNTKYWATYTGGTSAGQIEGFMTNINIDDNYGGASADSMFFLLHTIENVKPIADLDSDKYGASVGSAKEGAVVTFTFAFNEAMRAPMSSALVGATDSDVVVSFTGTGVTDATGVLTATDDPAIWSIDYPIGSGDGPLTATLAQGDIVDLAGLDYSYIAGDLSISVTVDNTAAIATGTAVDLGDHVLQIATNSTTKWVIYDSGDAAADELADFSKGGSGNATMVVEPGVYDVYFIDVDDAGNQSAIAGPVSVTIAN